MLCCWTPHLVLECSFFLVLVHVWPLLCPPYLVSSCDACMQMVFGSFLFCWQLHREFRSVVFVLLSLSTCHIIHCHWRYVFPFFFFLCLPLRFASTSHSNPTKLAHHMHERSVAVHELTDQSYPQVFNCSSYMQPRSSTRFKPTEPPSNSLNKSRNLAFTLMASIQITYYQRIESPTKPLNAYCAYQLSTLTSFDHSTFRLFDYPLIYHSPPDEGTTTATHFHEPKFVYACTHLPLHHHLLGTKGSSLLQQSMG